MIGRLKWISTTKSLLKVTYFFLAPRYTMTLVQNFLDAEIFVAEQHANLVPCQFLYRCKPKAYFDYLMRQKVGIMRGLKSGKFKDNTRSYISGAIRGILFTAKYVKNEGSDEGEPVPTSAEPSSCFEINVAHLIEPFPPRCHRLYFADFYCIPDSDVHCLVLVVVKPDCAVARYCRQRLMRLNWDCNKFFTANPSDDGVIFQVASAEKLVVKIMYTSMIRLKEVLRSKRATLSHDDASKSKKSNKRKKPSTLKQEDN